ncbi:hypothetical protein EDB89DRAFT_1861470, partial [Lactarius sanguifluus]
IKHHLAPLTVTANITQSSHCCLDEVLMMFASLAMQYSGLTNVEDVGIQKALLESIQKRWEASDQNVFVASMILNPFLKIDPFKQDAWLISLGAIHTLLSSLWTRFYPSCNVPPDVLLEICHYLSSLDFYSTMPGVCQHLKALATSKAWSSPNPLDVYTDITISGEPLTPLIQLATHILSICPNSASCEHLFSTFGLILTKLCTCYTCLSNQHVVNSAECKMHICDEHLEKEGKRCL